MYPSCPVCGVRRAIIRVRRTPWRFLYEILGGPRRGDVYRCYGCFTYYTPEGVHLMGYSTSAYVAYGVMVPVNPYSYDENGHGPDQQVDQALSVPTVKEACPDVGHLQAGEYDAQSFFLVTYCEEAGYDPTLLDYSFTGDPLGTAMNWDRQILHLLEVMGWTGLKDGWEPGFFVVASRD